MSSPFSQKFMGKSPMSQTAKQKANLPTEIVNAIAKKEGKKSPATMHHDSPAKQVKEKSMEELKAQLARVKKGEEGAEGQGGVDYELQVQIENKIKDKKKKNESESKKKTQAR